MNSGATAMPANTHHEPETTQVIKVEGEVTSNDVTKPTKSRSFVEYSIAFVALSLAVKSFFGGADADRDSLRKAAEEDRTLVRSSVMDTKIAVDGMRSDIKELRATGEDQIKEAETQTAVLRQVLEELRSNDGPG